MIFTTCKYVDIYAIPLPQGLLSPRQHKSEQKNTAAWGTKPQAKPEQPASTSTAEGEYQSVWDTGEELLCVE